MEDTEDKKPWESIWKQSTAEPQEAHHIGMNLPTRQGSTGHGQLTQGPSQGSPGPPNVGCALRAGQTGTQEAQYRAGVSGPERANAETH